MKLNQAKCEALRFGARADVQLKDKTPVNNVEQAKYLGCLLNKANDTTREVRGPVGMMHKMHGFCRHSDCTIKFKLTVLQAVMFAKILFGNSQTRQ